jgi:hypothetical protein
MEYANFEAIFRSLLLHFLVPLGKAVIVESKLQPSPIIVHQIIHYLSHSQLCCGLTHLKEMIEQVIVAIKNNCRPEMFFDSRSMLQLLLDCSFCFIFKTLFCPQHFPVWLLI